MGRSPILSVIHTVAIGTMLNFNGGNNGQGLQNVTCNLCQSQHVNVTCSGSGPRCTLPVSLTLLQLLQGVV